MTEPWITRQIATARTIAAYKAGIAEAHALVDQAEERRPLATLKLRGRSAPDDIRQITIAGPDQPPFAELAGLTRVAARALNPDLLDIPPMFDRRNHG